MPRPERESASASPIPEVRNTPPNIPPAPVISTTEQMGPREESTSFSNAVFSTPRRRPKTHERDEDGNQQGNGGLAQHDKEPYPRGVGVDGAVGRQSIETGVKEDEHHGDEQDGNHRGGRGGFVRLLVLREEGTGDGIGYLDGEFLTGEQAKAVAGRYTRWAGQG